MFRRSCAASALIALCISAGCSTIKTSNTARTGTEQLLISNAVDQTLDKVNFTGFHGRRVFLDTAYLDGVDKSYVIASIRHRLLKYGATLSGAAGDAEIVLEPRSGGIGTDNAETFYGVPEIVVPGLVTIPELKMATRNSQKGTAKLAFVAYDAKSKDILGDGGTSIAIADQNDWSVLGIGPFRNGSVKQELTTATSDDRYRPDSRLSRTITFDVPVDRKIKLTGHSNPVSSQPDQAPVESSEAPRRLP